MEQANDINTYTCRQCGGQIVTINQKPGVTPAFLTCRANQTPFPYCNGVMESAWYRCPQDLTPGYIWVAPTAKQLRRLARTDPNTAQHCRQGGLLLKQLTPNEVAAFKSLKEH